jgi:hypothetical protein
MGVMMDVFFETQQHYQKKNREIKIKAKEGKVINVGFFVLYDAVFPAKPLLEILEKQNAFRPLLILIPDTMRGPENMLYQLKKSYDYFSRRYSNVLLGYDEKTSEYVDYSEKLDFVCFSNPYDCLTHKYFTMEYLREKNVLPFYIHYGFSVTKYSRVVHRLDSFGYFWRVFTNTNLHLRELKKYAAGNGRNAIVTGYCKMDRLAEQNLVPRKRKTIIIAPHHTVREWKDGLEISNFLSYAEFFLHLPELYPNIDFIFRPHPLLFVTLKMEDMWGQQGVDEYLDRLLKNTNIKFSDEADYFDIFTNSDGIIHDCGSFVAEYLYTDHPACFILSNDVVVSKNFTPIGKKCLDFHYKSYSENDILNFIDNVVLLGNDPMLEARKQFSSSVLKHNYPNASDKIFEYIKEAIKND